MWVRVRVRVRLESEVALRDLPCLVTEAEGTRVARLGYDGAIRH